MKVNLRRCKKLIAGGFLTCTARGFTSDATVCPAETWRIGATGLEPATS